MYTQEKRICNPCSVAPSTSNSGIKKVRRNRKYLNSAIFLSLFFCLSMFCWSRCWQYICTSYRYVKSEKLYAVKYAIIVEPYNM